MVRHLLCTAHRLSSDHLTPLGKGPQGLAFLALRDDVSMILRLENGEEASDMRAEQAQASIAMVLENAGGAEADDETALLMAMTHVLNGNAPPQLPFSRGCAEAAERVSLGIVDAFPSFDPRWAEDRQMREDADVRIQETLAQMDSVIIAQQLDGKRQQHMALLAVLSEQQSLWERLPTATRAKLLGHAESLSLCMMLRQAQSERDQEGLVRTYDVLQCPGVPSVGGGGKM